MVVTLLYNINSCLLVVIQGSPATLKLVPLEVYPCHKSTKLLLIVLEHRANGARCPVVRRFKASSGVGNPVSHEVTNIDSVIQHDIVVWKEKGYSN
jgi:hypothetical protein